MSLRNASWSARFAKLIRFCPDRERFFSLLSGFLRFYTARVISAVLSRAG
jgi:hypothetical protein